MRRARTSIARPLGLAHGALDAATALLLARAVLAEHASVGRAALVVIAYNAVASGAQLAIGPALDARPDARRACVLAGLAAAALGLLGERAAGAGARSLLVALAALGSAAFHTAAGALALAATPGRARGAALFAAPGVVGLAVGALLVRAPGGAATVGVLAALVGSAVAFVRHEPRATTARDPVDARGVDVAVVAPLFVAIALRSLLLDGVGMRWTEATPAAFLALAVAAGAGKLLGGLFADRVGARRWIPAALGASACAFALSHGGLAGTLVAVALLQSAVPGAMALAAASMGSRAATASALVLGAAVIAGALPCIAGAGAFVAVAPVAAIVAFAAAVAASVASRRAGAAHALAGGPSIALASAAGPIAYGDSAPWSARSDAGAFTLVTLNTWRLRDAARVPRLLDALREAGRALDADDALPDVVALQELESPDAIRALAAALSPTHALLTYVCARRRDGAHRSVVGLAVRRARFDVASVERVPLGALWPDHPRGALLARLGDRRAPGRAVTVVAVHLSSHWWNRPQARALRERLAAHDVPGTGPALLAGDFNAPPALPAYPVLAAPPWRDAFAGEDRGSTHATGLRLDHVFVSRGVDLLRAIDPPVARRAVRAESRARLPLSDHRVEGGVFRVRAAGG